MTAPPTPRIALSVDSEILFRRVLRNPDGDPRAIAQQAYARLGARPNEAHRAAARELLALRGERKYSHIPASIRAMTTSGERQLVLFHLVEIFEDSFPALGLNDIVKLPFIDTFNRLLERWTDAGELADIDGSIFYKDLAICSLRLIPAGARSIDPDSGFPRRELIRRGPVDIVRALDYVYRRCGGPAPMLEVHLHPEERDYFSPDGFACTVHVARHIMNARRAIRGMFGGSWFYDPAAGRASPHLAYLSSLPGAAYFEGETSKETVNYALKHSKTRRRLHEAGEYRPAHHWMLWSRNGILNARQI